MSVGGVLLLGVLFIALMCGIMIYRINEWSEQSAEKGRKDREIAAEKKREFQATADALQADYDSALSALKAETSKENKIKVLETGRALARHCRKGGAVSIFDETALQNDLRAYGGE